MDEFASTKLNAENHLILEQSLLRLPLELHRRTFKQVQRNLEHERNVLLKSLKEAANDSQAGQDPDKTLAQIDTMTTRLRGLKRKMEAAHEEEKRLTEQTRKRLQHLQDLFEIHSLVDVKYDEWSRIRLDRLLVDYLLRMGYTESATVLAKEKGIEDLVDLDTFIQCHRVEESLRRGSTAEALAWCVDHKPLMKKMGSDLEFELRFQQYIDLRRVDKVAEARAHAMKHLAPHMETYPEQVHQAAGLLAFPPNTKADPYKMLYSKERLNKLANIFVKTHHELFSLPDRPLLHIALSAGLSALKTPSCHSKFLSGSGSNARSTSSTTSVCPICSEELNELARDLPYAHHSKSFVENDPQVLPNHRIYGKDRLLEMKDKLGMKGEVKDPVTGEIFKEEQMKKVYIS